MEKPFFLFKILEIILGLICLSIHVRGYLSAAFTDAHYVYIFVFVVFTLYAMYGCLDMCSGAYPSPLIEGIICLFGAAWYLTASLLAMYTAETDFYLMYLSTLPENFKGPLHPFFFYSKAQSIASLISCIMFMLHGTLSLDTYIIREPRTFSDRNDHEFDQPLKMYIGAKMFHTILDRKFEWFHKFGETTI